MKRIPTSKLLPPTANLICPSFYSLIFFPGPLDVNPTPNGGSSSNGADVPATGGIGPAPTLRHGLQVKNEQRRVDAAYQKGGEDNNRDVKGARDFELNDRIQYVIQECAILHVYGMFTKLH
jgi:hypothetical protein